MFTGTRGEGRGGRGRQRTRNDKRGGGGGGLQKIFYRALGASVWSKNKGELGPPGPLPWIPPLIIIMIIIINKKSKIHKNLVR